MNLSKRPMEECLSTLLLHEEEGDDFLMYRQQKHSDSSSIGNLTHGSDQIRHKDINEQSLWERQTWTKEFRISCIAKKK